MAKAEFFTTQEAAAELDVTVPVARQLAVDLDLPTLGRAIIWGVDDLDRADELLDAYEEADAAECGDEDEDADQDDDAES
jgi:hypothetical protein